MADERRFRVARWLVAALVLVTGTMVLVHTAWATVDQQSVNQGIGLARIENTLFDCFSDRAHELVAPGVPVVLRVPNLGVGINLDIALAPWVPLTSQKLQARVALVAKRGSGPHACGGYVLLTQAPTA